MLVLCGLKLLSLIASKRILKQNARENVCNEEGQMLSGSILSYSKVVKLTRHIMLI
jgi:hypothetical protein